MNTNLLSKKQTGVDSFLQAKECWFYIYPSVYVSFENPKKVLLYNTQNGDIITHDDPECVQLMRDLYEPKHLGVIELNSKHLQISSCRSFIFDIVHKCFGEIQEKDCSRVKPLNFLPVLNLQNDIEKMLKHDTEKGFVGSDILNYLSELNLYVTTSCKYACKLCDEYHKQYKSCFKPLSSHFLSCHTIKDILEQVKNSSLARINILGGNILLHPEWDILQSVLAGTSIIINIGQAI